MGKSIQKYEVSLNQKEKDFLINLTVKAKNQQEKLREQIFFYVQMKVKKTKK